MSETYKAMKMRQQEEVNQFPLGFAFSNEQFDEMMKGWGLNPRDTKAIVSIGSGGYVQEKDLDAFHKMMARHSLERSQAIRDDETGEGFIYQMFYYELCNHEYCVTGEADETLESLGYTFDQITESKALMHGFKKAQKEAMRCDW